MDVGNSGGEARWLIYFLWGREAGGSAASQRRKSCARNMMGVRFGGLLPGEAACLTKVTLVVIISEHEKGV
jgi:hypothetical protein